MKRVLDSATALAPGKIILCGEHAVVHGAPAFVQSLPIFTKVVIQPVDRPGIEIQSDLGHLQGSWKEQESLSDDPRWKWLTYLFHELEIDLTCSFTLTISSDLQMQSGMGSSAAVIAGVLRVLKKACRISLKSDEAWEIARKAENHCHGISSGIDLAASLWGGRLRFQQGKMTPLVSTPLEGVYTYFSGKPEDSTLGCVQQARGVFLSYPSLLEEMKPLLDAFEIAIQEGVWDEQRALIQSWHHLLVKLGVVPKPIQKLIESIERRGGAAKITGAGSFHGSQGGWMLIWADAFLAQELQSEGLALEQLQDPCLGAWGDEP